ncbi:hypothetical protein RchiOBHm_Chr2g0144941 [Rosa chinensis]|uniref:Uncharacterized protein n=1 Tax=Rosa chinensis TaxID=74649 RepID=A0A2P6RYH9_ROSCH|nr:hypothetical protein RchiOBHm_Chr2g0144941 [Rosa chinensis]
MALWLFESLILRRFEGLWICPPSNPSWRETTTPVLMPLWPMSSLPSKTRYGITLMEKNSVQWPRILVRFLRLSGNYGFLKLGLQP